MQSLLLASSIQQPITTRDVELRSAAKVFISFVIRRSPTILFWVERTQIKICALWMMPLNSFGWTSEEDEKLAELVEPHNILHVFDPSRKSILAREVKWQEIAQVLCKPVEECKKRWRGLRDGYVRSKRTGTIHKARSTLMDKLQFLDQATLNSTEEVLEESIQVTNSPVQEETITEQQVITDNQEYYEITVVDGPQEPILKPILKIVPKTELMKTDEPPKKVRRNGGRKKAITPLPKSVTPIKILPKPILMNGPKIVHYVEDTTATEQRSQTIDKLIERVLKENTNEIDVFFKSMAASVKKLQPNLIPKVKMEVCNVIAKYEMQSFDRNMQS